MSNNSWLKLSFNQSKFKKGPHKYVFPRNPLRKKFCVGGRGVGWIPVEILRYHNSWKYSLVRKFTNISFRLV